MHARLPQSSTTQVCAILILAMASAAVGSAQTHGYIVLHTFDGQDGSSPSAPLAIDHHGDLYGTASTGGDLSCNAPNGCGVVFKLSASSGFTLLHAFTGAPDGSSPEAGVILGAGGNLYGTTTAGGSGCSSYGCGSVYQLEPTGQESVLYSFTGGTTDGVGPSASLFQDAQQNLFGTTGSGGIQNVFGTAFEVSPSGAETVLHLFAQSPDGAFPGAAFVADAAGNLYSTTALGGSQAGNCAGVGCGTIFELSPSGASWNESVVYSFLGGADGIQPRGNLVKDASGNLYGVTAGGGSPNCGSFGCGTVFRLTRTSSGWIESVLYTFTGAADGANPDSLVADSRGNLYGATTSTLFALSSEGHFRVLHTFASDARPQVGLVIGQSQPIILGATAAGGDTSCNGGCGVIFAYAP